MLWTDDMLRDLRLLWTAGTATAEIGRRLGVSKNAVVGKAHRDESLTSRPSPLKPPNPNYVHPPRARRPPKLTFPSDHLPPLPPVVERPAPPKPTFACPALAPSETVRLYDAPMTPAPTPKPTLPPQPCQWPIGSPRDRQTFRFCGAAVVALGQPYCCEHFAKAYNRTYQDHLAHPRGQRFQAT